jgi:hypothetical protein
MHHPHVIAGAGCTVAQEHRVSLHIIDTTLGFSVPGPVPNRHVDKSHKCKGFLARESHTGKRNGIRFSGA